MERTQIYLTREQKKALKTIAAQKQLPVAGVVRDAVIDTLNDRHFPINDLKVIRPY